MTISYHLGYLKKLRKNLNLESPCLPLVQLSTFFSLHISEEMSTSKGLKTPQRVLERSKLYCKKHSEELRRKALQRYHIHRAELVKLGLNKEKRPGRPRLPLEEKIRKLIEKEGGSIEVRVLTLQ